MLIGARAHRLSSRMHYIRCFSMMTRDLYIAPGYCAADYDGGSAAAAAEMLRTIRRQRASNLPTPILIS